MSLEETVEGIMGTLIFITAIGGSCGYCFYPRTIREALVIDKGTYEAHDYETIYSEWQNTIKTDKHKECFRSPSPFGEDLKVGDVLEYLKWRPGWVGPCDYVVEYGLAK